MSLYIGRDNSGNGIFHATKDEQSETSLKAGVNEKTLFHSDIPFIRVSKTYNLGLTYRESRPPNYSDNFSTTSEYWAFPSAMKTDLRNGYVFLGFATMSDGSKIQIQSDKFCAHVDGSRVTASQGGGNWFFHQYGHSQEWGGSTASGLRFGFPISNSIKYFWSQNGSIDAWFSQNSSASWYSPGAGGWFSRQTSSTVNSSTNHPPYLHRDSAGVLLLRCGRGLNGPNVKLNDVVSGTTANANVTPFATSIVYYRLDVKANSSGYYPVTLSATLPGELYIDNSKLLTNGVDHLSNLKYIKFRGFYGNNTTVGATTSGGTLLPGNTYNYSQSVGGWPHGMLPTYTEVLYTGSADVPGHRKPYAVYVGGKYKTHTYGNFTGIVLTATTRTITPTSTMNNAVSLLPSYNGTLFELVSIPSVNEIEFTNTSFRINNSIDLYTSSNQPIACIGEQRKLQLDTTNRNIYPGGVVSTLEDSINLGSGLGSHLHLLFGMDGINTTDNYVRAYWDRTGGTLNMYPPTDARTTDPDLGPQLAAIPQNGYVHIGSMRFIGRDFYTTPNQQAAVGVSLTLRYTGTTLQLWSHARNVSTVGNYMQYRMPRASINIMRLTSG
ncbi:hypothetical protein VPHD410_0221 [Vibrio phage D410]